MPLADHRAGRPTAGRTRPTLLALELRDLPSTAVHETFRPFEFDVTSTAGVTAPWVVDGAFPGFAGQVRVAGRIDYDSPTHGAGTGVTVSGSGSGMQTPASGPDGRSHAPPSPRPG